MASFGGYSPFPVRMGGDAHKPVEGAFQTLRGNVGDAFDDSTTALNVQDDTAAARLVGYADAVVSRFLAEADPRKLTSMLDRWEAFLQIPPSIYDHDQDRRRRVSGRMLTLQSGDTARLGALSNAAVSPWPAYLHFTNASTVTASWPGNGATAAWTSTVMRLVIEFVRPPAVDDDTRTLRKARLVESLHDHTPAWAAFNTSETQQGHPYGFVLDLPNLDVSCFSS